MTDFLHLLWLTVANIVMFALVLVAHVLVVAVLPVCGVALGWWLGGKRLRWAKVRAERKEGQPPMP